MKIIGISDTHMLWQKPVARIDDIKKTQLIKWEFLLQYAKDEGAVVLEAGDFFNANRSWYLLPEVMDLLKKYGVKVLCVFGQHDTYLYNEKARASTSLGILEKAGLVTILGETSYHLSTREDYAQVIAIYGCSFGQQVPIIKNKHDFNILVIHASIAEKALYPNQKYLDALTFLKDNKFNLILAGDIHQKYSISYEGRHIINSGPLIRKEASIYNFNHHPGFFVFDTEKNDPPQFVEVPHQPAEEVLTRSHIEYEKEANNVLDEFISAIEHPEIEDGGDIIDNLWKFINANKFKPSVVSLLSEVVNKSNIQEV